MNILTFLRGVACGAAFILLSVLAPLCAAEPAHSATSTPVTGTIANVDGNNLKISIRGKDQAMTFLTVAAETAITRNGKVVTLDALHSGDDVKATFTGKSGEDSVATTIIASAAKPKGGRRKR